MSHCRPLRLSDPGAGSASRSVSADDASSATLPSSFVAKPLVATAPDTCALARSFWSKAAASSYPGPSPMR